MCGAQTMRNLIIQYVMLIMLLANIGIGISTIFTLDKLRCETFSKIAYGDMSSGSLQQLPELPELPISCSPKRYTCFIIEDKNSELDDIAKKLEEEFKSDETSGIKREYEIGIDWVEIIRGLNLETQLPQLPPEITDENMWKDLSEKQKTEIADRTMKVVLKWWNDLPESDKEKVRTKLCKQFKQSIDEVMKNYYSSGN